MNDYMKSEDAWLYCLISFIATGIFDVIILTASFEKSFLLGVLVLFGTLLFYSVTFTLAACKYLYKKRYLYKDDKLIEGKPVDLMTRSEIIRFILPFPFYPVAIVYGIVWLIKKTVNSVLEPVLYIAKKFEVNDETT